MVDVSGRGASFGVRASQPRAKFVTYELLPSMRMNITKTFILTRFLLDIYIHSFWTLRTSPQMM